MVKIMNVKEAIKKLEMCNPTSKLKIIQELELECMPEWWDSGKVKGEATEIYSEDVHSHQFYLLVIK